MESLTLKADGESMRIQVRDEWMWGEYAGQWGKWGEDPNVHMGEREK